MSEYIPFVTSEFGANLVRTLYSDATTVRIPVDRAAKLAADLPASMKVWIDAGIDGMDDVDARRSTPDKKNPWFEYMKTVDRFEKVSDRKFQENPVTSDVTSFVQSVMAKCIERSPKWITVPQLPITSDTSRNKINRALAVATGKWRTASGFSGRLILPLVITHQDQVNGKTARNPKVVLAARCYREAQADGLWVVDSTLSDESGSVTLRNKRLPGLIAFHEEINDQIPSKIRVGGPYWGANLVLWAKGLIDRPAIGLGSGYRYFVSGSSGKQPNVRIALPPLRRRVGLADLADWLDKAMDALSATHPAYAEFDGIRTRLLRLADPDRAKTQVGRFYRDWLASIAATPKPGRSMALFQDLSGAYALGKSLPDLSRDEGTARRPESVAEPLMLSCL